MQRSFALDSFGFGGNEENGQRWGCDHAKAASSREEEFNNYY